MMRERVNAPVHVGDVRGGLQASSYPTGRFELVVCQGYIENSQLATSLSRSLPVSILHNVLLDDHSRLSIQQPLTLSNTLDSLTIASQMATPIPVFFR